MKDAITIVSVNQDGEDGVLVTFSDRTVAGYVVEELLHLRPVRELPDHENETELRHASDALADPDPIHRSLMPSTEAAVSTVRLPDCTSFRTSTRLTSRSLILVQAILRT